MVGIGNIGDDDYVPDFVMDKDLSPEEYRHSLILEENRKLKEDLESKTKENELNHNALQMLIKICKERGFDPFPNEDFPFKKAVKDMSKEELIAKNRAAAERIEETRAVDSKDKTPMPSAHILESKYATETPTFTEDMEELLTKIETYAVPSPETVHSHERKVIFSSSEEPYDPYKNQR